MRVLQSQVPHEELAHYAQEPAAPRQQRHAEEAVEDNGDQERSWQHAAGTDAATATMKMSEPSYTVTPSSRTLSIIVVLIILIVRLLVSARSTVVRRFSQTKAARNATRLLLLITIEFDASKEATPRRLLRGSKQVARRLLRQLGRSPPISREIIFERSYLRGKLLPFVSRRFEGSKEEERTAPSW